MRQVLEIDRNLAQLVHPPYIEANEAFQVSAIKEEWGNTASEFP